jgi:outer membrane protein, heavy metal efflux system
MYYRHFLFLSPLLALSACQSNPHLSLVQPGQIVRREVSTKAVMPGSGPLSFGEAALLALQNNPGLASFNPALRASDGMILQASLKPNPTLDGQIEDALGTGTYRGFDAAESTVAVSQLIERDGKPEARRSVQMADRALVLSDYEIARREIFTEVGQAFAQALAAQEKIDLYRGLVELNESFLPEIDKRIEAGKVTAVERSRAKTAVTTARLARLQAEREFKIARLRLAATWGSTTATFDRVVGKIGELPSIADQSSLEQRLRSHPAYQKETKNIAKSAAEHRLALVKGKQDVTIRGGVRRFWASKDEVSLVVGFSIPLPFNDSNQGEIAATAAQLEVGARQRDAALAGLKAKLNTALQTLAATRNEADTITGELLPGAQEAFEGVQDGYSKGRLGYLDLIEARRSLTEARVQLLEAKAAYQEAAAEIAGLTAPLPGENASK